MSTVHQWELPPGLASIRTARALVTEHLRADADVAAASVLVSEAVTDLIVYGGSVTLTLESFEDRIRVEVSGGGGGRPIETTPAAHDARLLLLDAYATRWGSQTSAGHDRCIWFELVFGSPQSAHPAGGNR